MKPNSCPHVGTTESYRKHAISAYTCCNLMDLIEITLISVSEGPTRLRKVALNLQASNKFPSKLYSGAYPACLSSNFTTREAVMSHSSMLQGTPTKVILARPARAGEVYGCRQMET